MNVYGDLFRYRELFGSLFRRDLRAKYRGSVLGLAWSLANPIVLMLVYLLVFSVFWKAPATDRALLAVPALRPSRLGVLRHIASGASRSLLENANLIRKVRFPRQLVPLANVASQLVAFVVMLAIVIGWPRLRAGARDTVWLAVPLAALVVCLVAGVALAVASANAIFRDIEQCRSVAPTLVLPYAGALRARPGPRHQDPSMVRAPHPLGQLVTPAIESLRGRSSSGTLRGRPNDLPGVAAGAALGLGAFVFTRVDDRIAVEV